MDRRSCLKTVVLAGTAAALPGAAGKPIQLHVDLDVDPAKEKEMLGIFRTKFRPAASRQPGFIEAKMLKFESAVVGQAPANFNYRFLLSFQTEDQRKAWVATPEHQKLWPTIEATLRSKTYNGVLYDVT